MAETLNATAPFHSSRATNPRQAVNGNGLSLQTVAWPKGGPWVAYRPWSSALVAPRTAAPAVAATRWQAGAFLSKPSKQSQSKKRPLAGPKTGERFLICGTDFGEEVQMLSVRRAKSLHV